eukprot:Blabericola_migrator_1__8308@NODE_4312_length_1224_cov_16_194468_g2666_i0_p1_GENE_NODE_4312_length_1224_cov_16_194468_g2666_i0NODE_4312_length_1224_cov_16_194468_g2666_i0_p1_ORF_typecomplete_len105_score13_74_NODE_4312_length_1224_cov_16_194468_g2666_i0369683
MGEMLACLQMPLSTKSAREEVAMLQKSDHHCLGCLGALALSGSARAGFPRAFAEGIQRFVQDWNLPEVPLMSAQHVMLCHLTLCHEFFTISFPLVLTFFATFAV